jgi:hypothetical protein
VRDRRHARRECRRRRRSGRQGHARRDHRLRRRVAVRDAERGGRRGDASQEEPGRASEGTRRQAADDHHLRPAHGPADHGRDVARSRRADRPRRQPVRIQLAAAGGVGASELRPACAQRERQPHESVPPGQRQARADEVRPQHRRHGRQRAAERGTRVHRRPRGRPGRPVLGRPGDRAELSAGGRGVRGRGAQRSRRWPAVHGRPGLRRLARRAGGPLRRLLGPGRGPAVELEPVCGVAALPRDPRSRPAGVHGRGAVGPLVHDPRQPRHDLAGHVPRRADPQLPHDVVHQAVPQRQVRPGALQGESGPDRAGPRGFRVRGRAARRGAPRSARSQSPLHPPRRVQDAARASGQRARVQVRVTP